MAASASQCLPDTNVPKYRATYGFAFQPAGHHLMGLQSVAVKSVRMLVH